MAAKKPPHKAKPTTHKTGKNRLASRVKKYARYRATIGKPNGPGEPGNKSGANKLR